MPARRELLESLRRQVLVLAASRPLRRWRFPLRPPPATPRWSARLCASLEGDFGSTSALSAHACVSRGLSATQIVWLLLLARPRQCALRDASCAPQRQASTPRCHGSFRGQSRLPTCCRLEPIDPLSAGLAGSSPPASRSRSMGYGPAPFGRQPRAFGAHRWLLHWPLWP